jgi:hypothetical protein
MLRSVAQTLFRVVGGRDASHCTAAMGLSSTLPKLPRNYPQLSPAPLPTPLEEERRRGRPLLVGLRPGVSNRGAALSNRLRYDEWLAWVPLRRSV